MTNEGFNLGDLMPDQKVVDSGVWVDYFQGSRLLLSSTLGKKYKAKMAQLARANRMNLDDANPNNYDLVQEITCEALATTVLLDWSGFHLPKEDGTLQKNVPYTPELGKMVLMRAERLREFILEEAGKPSHFKAAAEAAKKP